MADVYELVASALTGSLATTIFTKYFEIREKKNEFERDLKKTFFVSKLKCAEDIYAQLTIVFGSLHHTIVLLKIQRNDVREIDDFKEIAKSNLLERSAKAIEKVEGAINSSAFSYGLYFGGKNDAEFLLASEEIHISFGEMKKVIEALHSAIYPDPNSGLSASEQKLIYDKAVIDYQAEFDKIIELYEEMKLLLQIRLKDLHDYFQKYNLSKV
jgi:hypothetical protein